MLTNARLNWDDQGMPHSADHGDIYYSQADALGESTHVFLNGNELPARFAGLAEVSTRPLMRQRFTVGELGFGAGLNFLNTCRLWRDTAPAGAMLHYLACELHPFAQGDLQRLLQQFTELAEFSAPLLAACPDHTAGVHQLALRFDHHTVMLTLLYGDAHAMLTALMGETPDFRVDAWFLDGFSPKVNPDLWQLPLLQVLRRCSHGNTTLSTYSVSTTLRSALKAAGFTFEKRRGFTGKRHMLTARLVGAPPIAPAASRTVCIIGGGLAGCSTAHALAESGWQVTLLEKADNLASAGSGNLQAVLHCKPGTAHSADNDFNLHAYLHASRHYDSLQPRGLPWHRCGMLHVGTDSEQLRRFTRIHQSGRFNEAILQPMDARAASALAGVELTHPCLYFPLSGWLSPAALCRFYTDHPGITVHCGATAEKLQRTATLWEVSCTNGNSLQADAVILCNAGDLFDFPQCRHLPLICNRGQVDVYTSSAASSVRTILCGQGYLTPASDGQQSLGGSYYVEGTSNEHNRLQHLQLLARMDSGLANELGTKSPVHQRVGQRCQTPDRMPLVGALDATLPGLYLNVAHGSNGLARTPITAALLASLLSNTPPPLPATLRALLEPARFRR